MVREVRVFHHQKYIKYFIVPEMIATIRTELTLSEGFDRIDSKELPHSLSGYIGYSINENTVNHFLMKIVRIEEGMIITKWK